MQGMQGNLTGGPQPMMSQDQAMQRAQQLSQQMNSPYQQIGPEDPRMQAMRRMQRGGR